MSIRLTWVGGTARSATRSQFAQRARVRRLVLFHHDPYHTDADLEAMLDDARRAIDAPDDWVCLAYEGMTVEFDDSSVCVPERVR